MRTSLEAEGTCEMPAGNVFTHPNCSTSKAPLSFLNERAVMPRAAKSAALIMRKIRPAAMAEARALAVQEAGEWLAAMTLRESATPASLLLKMREDAAAK